MRTSTRNALYLAVGFSVVAALWTVVLDHSLLGWLGHTEEMLQWHQIKTWSFIVVAGSAVFFGTRTLLDKWGSATKALASEIIREPSLGAGVTEYAIYLLDPEGIVTSWNVGASRITGWQAGDIVGKHFRTIFTEADVANHEPERIIKAATAEGRFACDRQLRRNDGTRFWASTTLTLLRNPGLSVRGFACVSRDVSAQREAAAALADSERLFRIFFAQAAVGIAQFSPAGKILRSNAFFCDIVGRSEQSLRKINLADLTHTETYTNDFAQMQLCLDGEIDSFEQETRYMRPDGHAVWVSLSMSLVRDDSDHPAYFVGVVADITARKEAEAAVEENRTRLAGIVETTRDAIITTDASLRIVVTNPAAKEMFRRNEEEWLGHSLFTLFPEKHRSEIQRFTEDDESHLMLGGVQGITALRANGEQFPIEGSILRISVGSDEFYTVMLRDNTERRRYEEAIADSGHRLQVAIDAAHLGFWDLNLESMRLFMSDELKRILGFAADVEPVDPEKSIQLVHPEDRPKIDDMTARLLDPDGGNAAVELRVRHSDGSYRDLSIHSVMLRSEDGKPDRMLGTVLEMTPIREAERKVRRLSARILSLQDAERRRIARELHDTTAQNLAALNIALGRLRRALERERSTHTGLVDDSVALADMSVQQIRTMSYLLHPPLLDEFGLERAAQDYVGGFSERSGIQADLTIDGAIGRLPDEVELSLFRVLQESLANVVRHSGCTQARVLIGREANSVFLEVSDNGRGIAPGTLERLQRQAPLGVGVTGMTERLAQIGGKLDISSNNSGTTVRASVSVDPGSSDPNSTVSIASSDLPDQ